MRLKRAQYPLVLKAARLVCLNPDPDIHWELYTSPLKIHGIQRYFHRESSLAIRGLSSPH